MADPKTQVATPAVKVDDSLDKALAAKPRAKGTTPKTLWIGMSVTGDSMAIVKAALDKVGETNYSAYVKRLILTDLKARLNGQK